MGSVFKKTVLLAIACVAIGSMAPGARAAEVPMHEVFAFTSSDFVFGSGTDTSFDVNVGYSYTLTELFQATAFGGFLVSDPVSTVQLLVGPTFNLPLDNTGIRNAVFARGLIGFSYRDALASTTDFGYNVAIGKRFELFGIVTWKPEFSMSGTTGTGSNPVFALSPIALSFVF